MTKEVIINGRPLMLRSDQLIQSGGEGMVFEVGDRAIKLYHHPRQLYGDKLLEWMNRGLSARLPANLLGPCQLVYDDRQRVIGFQMKLLPPGCLPLKHLSHRQALGKMGISAREAVGVFREMHSILSAVHQAGVVVGDLNDHNVHICPAALRDSGRTLPFSYWIDVDSYQFGGHPCPAAMLACLDPNLYGISDFADRPVFSSLTDWYAFLVLLTRSLLQVHPYGGLHHQLKTLQARASASISILNPSVSYPRNALPLEILPDDLLDHMHQVFEQGKRMRFPEHLLTQYEQTQLICSQCGLAYTSERPRCPACSRQTPAVARPHDDGRPQKVLLQVDGSIEHVAVQRDGRILVVVREGNAYKLVRAGIGGKLDETDLFGAAARYQFGVFGSPAGGHFLVVNPVHDRRLLVMDLSSKPPRQIAMLETELFRQAAVFAATQERLFRIAGGWIMSGSVQDGLYVEDAVATSHKAQTQFWPSPFGDVIAGYHRVFDEQRYFLVSADRTGYEIPIPQRSDRESIRETEVRFSPRLAFVVLKIVRGGIPHLDVHACDLRGQIHTSLTMPQEDLPTLAFSSLPFTADPALQAPPFIRIPAGLLENGTDRVYHHPAGLLIRRPGSLTFSKFNERLDKV